VCVRTFVRARLRVRACVFLSAGTCNFNNRYLLAVARENSPAMMRYRVGLQKSPPESGVMLKSCVPAQTGSGGKEEIALVRHEPNCQPVSEEDNILREMRDKVGSNGGSTTPGVQVHASAEIGLS
jgi:hypothetical protein